MITENTSEAQQKIKNVWEEVKSKNLIHDQRYRDVFSEQNLERSRLKSKKKPLIRQVLTGMLVVFVFFFVYFLLGMLETFIKCSQLRWH